MKLLRLFACLTAAAGGATGGTLGAQSELATALFPFVLPWNDATPGATDLSGWQSKPAGHLGHIRVSGDGHFHAGSQRIRFLGVNLSFAGGMPEKAAGENIAARLAKFGINVVRFHHMDTSAWPNGLRAHDAKSTGELDPEALERLDYFIAQLKQRGIYANLNLLVGRPFNAADGLPRDIEKLDWKDRHVIGFFDPAQLSLQKDYARKLLTHENPYTRSQYAEDPAVAFVEINNENGLVHAWLSGAVDRLPEIFRDELRAQWNEWLKQRYRTSETLRQSWQIGAEPLGNELLANTGFARQLEGWDLEQHAAAKMKAAIVDDAPARVSFSSLGKAGATCDLAAVSLRPGGVLGLAAAEQLEQRTMPLFDRKTFGERTADAQRDWMRFLEATEDHYWQTLRHFLKDELQVRALVTGTIVGCSPPNLMAKMDWVDTHSYWQHPRFPGRPWDAGNWLVDNRTMVNEKGGTLPGLALKRIAGKPHAVTEYNHPAPNTFCSEGFLLLAAYAALQDWDAIYVYAYAHSRQAGWDTKQINGFFDIDQHPTKMATLPAAAAMFVRGDVHVAQRQVVGDLSQEREVDLLRRARSWSLVDAAQVGVPREAALIHRVAIATEGRTAPADAMATEQVKVEQNRFASDTGELVWDLSQTNRGVVTVNTAHSKAVIGYGGGRRFVLGDVTIEPGPSLQNGWCAITLTAMDAERAPRKLLITATGYAENTGMVWKNAEHSSVGRDWGNAPSRVEGIPARIVLPLPSGRVQAWALDERGQRNGKLPVDSDADGSATLNLGPQWQTLWYEVKVK